ncbi:hypothetical protein CSB92_1456 [Pseudomonas aeruginosa]|nr:hypothetical protein CSB90_0864 [Pseudomonas aeruginosa]AWF68369.1 hypothetical protein CSC27_5243 [Pseudomonas aeruginosa]AZP62744.1 Branched-chain amino acid ABC transporter, amino acid-binding protein [Pseudomonas aeruginosa]PRW12369.1 hypothetical protein CSB92_1456 [Pseudomonas aeruginosa]BAT68195.1 hypothetical protein IOMTU133_5746 [Pseudomonas aeruginosa]
MRGKTHHGRNRESQDAFSEQLLGHGVLLLRMMLALVTTMLLLCFAQQAEQAACHSFFS